MELPRELIILIQEKLWLLPAEFTEYEKPFLTDEIFVKLQHNGSQRLIDKFLEMNPDYK